MAHYKYGVINARGFQGKMLPIAASQYFRHNGLNLVYLDSNGRVTTALTATATLFGIAKAPAGRGSGTSDDYFLSSSTAGKDEILVYPFVMNPGMLMLLPADATVTAAMRGNSCDIIAVNDGTATTVDVGTSSTKVLIIMGLGTDYAKDAAATDVVVVANPAKIQAD